MYDDPPLWESILYVLLFGMRIFSFTLILKNKQSEDGSVYQNEIRIFRLSCAVNFYRTLLLVVLICEKKNIYEYSALLILRSCSALRKSAIFISTTNAFVSLVRMRTNRRLWCDKPTSNSVTNFFFAVKKTASEVLTNTLTVCIHTISRQLKQRRLNTLRNFSGTVASRAYALSGAL